MKLPIKQLLERTLPVKCLCPFACEQCGKGTRYRIVLAPKEPGGAELKVCESCYNEL